MLDWKDVWEGEKADWRRSAEPRGLEIGWPRIVMGEGRALDEWEEPMREAVLEIRERADGLALRGEVWLSRRDSRSLSVGTGIGSGGGGIGS